MDTDRQRRSDSPHMMPRTSWLFRTASRPRSSYAASSFGSNDLNSSNNNSNGLTRPVTMYEATIENNYMVGGEIPATGLPAAIDLLSTGPNNSNASSTYSPLVGNVRPRQPSLPFNYAMGFDESNQHNYSLPSTPRSQVFTASSTNRFFNEPNESNWSATMNGAIANGSEVYTSLESHQPMSSELLGPPSISAESLMQQRKYEYYGFSVYLISIILAVLFSLWAYLPDQVLINVGIAYFPSKHWAIAFPAWTMMLFLFIYPVFMNEFATIRSLGERTATAVVDDTIELHDLPISVVNACLYGRDDSSDNEVDTDDPSSTRPFNYSGVPQNKINSRRNSDMDDTLAQHNFNLDLLVKPIITTGVSTNSSANTLSTSWESTTAIGTRDDDRSLEKTSNGLHSDYDTPTLLLSSVSPSDSPPLSPNSTLTRSATLPDLQERRAKRRHRPSLRLGSFTSAMSSLPSPNFLKSVRHRSGSDSAIHDHNTAKNGEQLSPKPDETAMELTLPGDRRRSLAPARVAASAMAFSSAVAARLKPNFARS